MDKEKKKWSVSRKAQYSFIKEHLHKVSSGSSMLDVGAGACQFEDLYRSFKKTGVDFSPYPGVDVLCDLEKGLPFGDSTFDLVVATNVFEHIYSAKELIEECYRVTKTEGFLIGTTPFQLCVHQEPYDYFRYTNFALEKMIVDAGYAKVQIYSVGTPDELLIQTSSHFYMMLCERLKKKPFLYLATRIFWKLQIILIRAVLLVCGRLPPSMKHTLGYGFVAEKL